MPKKNRSKQHQDEQHLERELRIMKHTMARLAPPKVENRLVTTVSIFGARRNTVVLNDRQCSMAFSGNGMYQFNNVSATPTYLFVP